MDQHYNNSQNEFLWKLLANPADDAHLYAYDLQRLVSDFPQSSVLHALLAHASDDKNLRQASVYFNARSLYKLINAPSTFIGVPGERIIIENSIGANGHYKYAEPPVSESLHSFHEDNTGNNIDEAYSNNNTTFEEVKEELAVDVPLVQGETHAAKGDEHLTESSHHATENDIVETPVENKVEEAYETLPPLVETIHQNQESETTAEPLENRVEELPEAFEHKVEEADDAMPPPVGAADQANENEAIEALVEYKIEEAHEAAPHPEEVAYQTSEHQAIQTPVGHKAEETQDATPPLVETAYQTSEHGAIQEFDGHKIDEAQEAPAIENNAADSVPHEAKETALEDRPPVPQEYGLADNEPAAVEHTVEASHEETKEEEEEEQKAPVVEPRQEEPGQQVADDEVFDEIVSIEQINLDAKNPQQTDKTRADEEALINGGIASSDFFAFDKTFGEHKPARQEEIPAPVETGPDAGHQDVSKYHDEKMPYTFMWWLDKTRKEHAATYQPYIKPASSGAANKPKKPADELQQQYFENIFHITSVEELDKSTQPPVAPYAVKPKEHTIIERFIKEEPQIRPQSSEKIDNENKAKKSSEDRDELVTETLAAIYSDQMLYHKAIASYKKLMLKFPEKSRYFAGKIEQLEKKTN